MKKEGLEKRKTNVAKAFTKKKEIKKAIQKELPSMPEKDELYRAGEKLAQARDGLSSAHAENKEASESFIKVSKGMGKSSITITEDGVSRTFKVNHTAAKITVAMIKEK